MGIRRLITAGGAAALVLCACENSGAGRVVNPGAVGTMGGVAYFDANGNGFLDFTDPGQPGIRVFVLARGSRDTVARPLSGSNGGYLVAGIPVGEYDVVVDSGTVGDTARLVRVDNASFTLGAGDSVSILVGVSFPTATVAEARGLPAGVRVFVTGVALNAPTTFGDSTVHLIDSTGAIRATRVPAGLLLIGDSVRFLGTRGARDGQPTLDNVNVFPTGGVGAPVPVLVTTAAADTADGGRLDAALVKVSDAEITETTTIDRPAPLADDVLLTVEDGEKGAVIVFLDGDASLSISGFVPGARIDATGVLVPTGSGTWQLKPRVNADVVLR